MNTKNCREIVKEYLKTNSYDGLFNMIGDCSCEVNNLTPCCENISYCEPGYKHDDKSGECEWIMWRDKEKE